MVRSGATTERGCNLSPDAHLKCLWRLGSFVRYTDPSLATEVVCGTLNFVGDQTSIRAFGLHPFEAVMNDSRSFGIMAAPDPFFPSIILPKQPGLFVRGEQYC